LWRLDEADCGLLNGRRSGQHSLVTTESKSLIL
jgi:hypothetical protein